MEVLYKKAVLRRQTFFIYHIVMQRRICREADKSFNYLPKNLVTKTCPGIPSDISFEPFTRTTRKSVDGENDLIYKKCETIQQDLSRSKTHKHVVPHITSFRKKIDNGNKYHFTRGIQTCLIALRKCAERVKETTIAMSGCSDIGIKWGRTTRRSKQLSLNTQTTPEYTTLQSRRYKGLLDQRFRFCKRPLNCLLERIKTSWWQFLLFTWP